ncbi:MAG: hypothetical protein FJZ78_06250 [Bacteroidetes bacterium]|nr:hypothetical protein [Bacteroidota bacterium]
MIKFPSLFGRIPRHQRFNYEPRYYDAKKEEREARDERIRLEVTGETDDYSTGKYRTRISGAFKSSRKNSKAPSPELSALVVRLGIMLLLTIMLIAWLQWGQTAFYLLLLIVPVYIWVRFPKKK